MCKQLSQKAEELFELIADNESKIIGSQSRNPTKFEEPMEALNITNAKDLNDILEEIKQIWGELVIKEIHFGGAWNEYDFKVGSKARACWEEYKEQKAKVICPKCELPLKEKTITYCPGCDYELDKK